MVPRRQSDSLVKNRNLDIVHPLERVKICGCNQGSIGRARLDKTLNNHSGSNPYRADGSNPGGEPQSALCPHANTVGVRAQVEAMFGY